MRKEIVTGTVLSMLVLLLISVGASAATTTLYTPIAGDATYEWNTKYGPTGYVADGTTMDVNVYFGSPYGNDYRVSIFEIPISPLAGQVVTGATLQVDSLGFDTGYYYGSARIGWLDVGDAVVTGDVVSDALGPASKSMPAGFTIYDSDSDPVIPGTPGTKSFDVLGYVQADLAAGRAFSTFVMSGSRETWGSIYTAENGNGTGPRIIATPEPATLSLLALGGLAMIRRRR
ncbi:MAG: PEP-CTERM sorting domain-containing protein [Planctomycetes bacterium]|nr:PEP-CTERM sorting domain-containing protein [Planctomycetota bacterium]